MSYTPPIKGKFLKKSVKSPYVPSLAEGVGGLTAAVEEIRFLKEDIIQTVDRELERVDSAVEEVSKMQKGEKGDPGEDADEMKIAQWVLDHIPVPKDGRDGKDADEEKIVSKVAKMVPRSDEIAKEVLRMIPEHKASLKVIQEKIEIDPEVLMGHLEKLAPEIKKKFGIDDLDKIVKILDRRYIHGGGDTVVAGTNVTITRNANGDKVINSTAGGSGTVTDVTSNDGSITVTNPTTTPDLAVAFSPQVTVADAGGDATTFPLLAGSATGNQQPLTDAGLTYNATTNALTASSFVGNLSGNATTATDTASKSGTGSTYPTTASPTIATPTLDGGFYLDGTPNSDNTFNGPSTNSFNAGATIAQWEAVYLDSSSTWQLTDADAASTAGSGMVAIATAAGTNGNPLRVALPGSFVRNDAWNWTVGGAIYLSTTAGALTQTQPSGTDDVIRVVGWAMTADVIYWYPSGDYITHV